MAGSDSVLVEVDKETRLTAGVSGFFLSAFASYLADLETVST